MEIIHETILEININRLKSNFSYLKGKLKAKTKIIAVMKAYAYGHGDIILAKKLEEIGVHALWVADFEEGSRLRESGIQIPIIIANPGTKSTRKIIDNKLDVVIYNFKLLQLYGELNKEICIHIKFNTGMNRYGFNPEEIKLLTKTLLRYPKLKLQSICSHLAATDNPKKDEFTNKQCLVFDTICTTFFQELGYEVDRHILNTNGVLRFSKNECEMVRLGIGLYGVANDNHLEQISTLKSIVSQVRKIRQGDQIGYDATFVASTDMQIGIIPFGYADGLNRKLSIKNGVVIINNTHCPIIGKISMDSCIVDLSNTAAKAGDEVIIFGKENTVLAIAKKLDTIPYEIFSTLNRRIKRVYSC
ncbi:MAG TPA: alanine racemase [Flavobacteriales bacterium]|nr:alanine racemase [Flavobacteriales bacterium]